MAKKKQSEPFNEVLAKDLVCIIRGKMNWIKHECDVVILKANRLEKELKKKE